MKKRRLIKIRNFQINFSNKIFYTILLISIVILLGVGVYAYGTSNPSSFGHSIDELDFNGDLEVNGDIFANAYYYSSDERLKENVVKIGNAVDTVESLEGVYFNWKENGEKSIGLIAQDVEKVLPEVVLTNEETGMKSISYGNIVAVLIEAVKEQQKEIDELKEQIKDMNQ
jgi:hypothetical protein